MSLSVIDCHFDMTAISRAFSAAIGDESVQADGLGGFIEGKAAKVSSIFVAAGVVFEQIAHDLHAGLVQHGPRFGSDRRRGRERRVGGQQFVRRCRGHG